MSFQSRSGRYLSFKDAIDRVGTERFGDDWPKYTCHTPAAILPIHLSAASEAQIDYAIAILRAWFPETIFQRKEIEANDSVPSFWACFGTGLQLTDQQWSLAQTQSAQVRKRMAEADVLLRQILGEFADAAARGRTRTFIRGANSYENRELEPEYWEVHVDVLLARYQSSTMQRRSSTPEPATLQSVNRGLPRSTAANIVLDDWQRLVASETYVILVGRDVQDSATDVNGMSLEEKEAYIKKQLASAARENPEYPPYGSAGRLYKVIRDQLGCSLERAMQIVAENPTQKWQGGGNRKNVAKQKGNSIIIA